MINNSDQYSITKHWLTKFETSVRLLNSYGNADDTLYLTKVNSLNSQIEKFKKGLHSYEHKIAIDSINTCELDARQAP